MPDDTRQHIGERTRGSTLSYATAKYLMDELQGYAEQSPEDEYETGRKEALEDMLRDIYGIKAV